MRPVLVIGVASALLASAFAVSSPPPAKGVSMNLELRTRVQPFRASSAWTEADFEQSFPNPNSAIIITDMWDKHWCRGATERVGEIARKMEPLLQKARASGILIIHAPSDTMSFYVNTPGRRLALDAPPPRRHRSWSCTTHRCPSTTATVAATRPETNNIAPGAGRSRFSLSAQAT